MSELERDKGHFKKMKDHKGPVHGEGPIAHNVWNKETTPKQGAGGGGITKPTSDQMHQRPPVLGSNFEELVRKQQRDHIILEHLQRYHNWNVVSKEVQKLKTAWQGIMDDTDRFEAEAKSISPRDQMSLESQLHAANSKLQSFKSINWSNESIKLIQTFLQINIDHRITPYLENKVKRLFYAFIHTDFPHWSWHIIMSDEQQKNLDTARTQYKTAISKKKTINLNNGDTKVVTDWDRHHNKFLFKPPDNFGVLDPGRAGVAWKQAVIKDTPPENGFITATPNPYVLDFAL